MNEIVMRHSTPDTSDVISYETPMPPAKRVHPIVWWFVADGVLFVLAFMILVGFYHEQPVSYSAPPGVDAIIYTLLLASGVLFVGLLVWGAVLLFRRRGHGG